MPVKRVLVAPMDWGLGHATRCIPIINWLLTRNIVVVIAGSGDSLKLLENEYPHLKSYQLPAYNPRYGNGSMVWQMARQIPGFIRVINQEHGALQNLVQNEKIDLVISDNRFGCWSDKVPSYIVTHQTNILMPDRWRWMQGVVNYFNRRQIRKFKECLVPDVAHQYYSGSLSDHGNLTVNFIGLLSRFSHSEILTFSYDILVLLSGPEPQRSRAEEMLIDQLKSTERKVLFVRGVFDEMQLNGSTSVEYVNFLNAEMLQRAINQSQIVICRSGYSTIMDLARLGKKAIFIPTPGQTEQEYLAARMMQQGIAYSMSQINFDLVHALEQSTRYRGFGKDDEDGLLDDVIQRMLQSSSFHD